MKQEARTTVIVQRNFVTNFIEFGALQRVRTSWMLLDAFESASIAGEASAALGIFQNLLNQYEDVMLWLEVVLKWREAETLITQLVDDARFDRLPDLRYFRKFETNPTKMSAFQEKLRWQDLLNCDASGPAFASRLGLPYSDEALGACDLPEEDRRWIRSEIDALASLKYRYLQETRHYLGDVDGSGQPFSRKSKAAPGFFPQWPI